MKSGQFFATNKKQSAFTLIELLVVIGIISLLLSILLPTIRLVTSLSRQTVCQSNLRQLGIMSMMYSHDFNDFILPSARNSDPQLRYPDNQDISLGGPPWYELLRETQGLDCNKDDAAILHCPSDRRDKGYCSYSANRYIMGFSSPRNISEAAFPARRITSIKGQHNNLIMLGERGCVEEGDIGKVDGQWSMSGIGVSQFLGANANAGIGKFGFYAGRHSKPKTAGDGGSQFVSNVKLPFLLLDGHADIYKGKLGCTYNDGNFNEYWEHDNISVLQSPGGYWPKLWPGNSNGHD
ncbi:MAG: type II secretion system protein [Anaerohalosphaera sp.]|nr:type II secretion system protein [Anaerohalosphaera sp.]